VNESPGRRMVFATGCYLANGQAAQSQLVRALLTSQASPRLATRQTGVFPPLVCDTATPQV